MYTKEEWTPAFRASLIGQRVKHPDRRIPSKIKTTVADTPGEVILEREIMGRRGWNLIDLSILDDE